MEARRERGGDELILSASIAEGDSTFTISTRRESE